jgi:type II secretory pathway component PulL
MARYLLIYLNVSAGLEPLIGQTLCMDERGKILDISAPDVRLSEIDRSAFKGAEIIVILGAEQASYFTVEIPVKLRQNSLLKSSKQPKKEALIGFLLEDQLVDPIEDLHFVLGPRISTEAETASAESRVESYSVVVCARSTLARLLAAFQAIEMMPHRVITAAMCFWGVQPHSILFCDGARQTVLLCMRDGRLLLLDSSLVEGLAQNIGAWVGKSSGDFECYRLSSAPSISTALPIPVATDQVVTDLLPFLAIQWFKSPFKAEQSMHFLTGPFKPKWRMNFHFNVYSDLHRIPGVSWMKVAIVMVCISMILQQGIRFSFEHARRQALIQQASSLLRQLSLDRIAPERALSQIRQETKRLEEARREDAFFILLSKLTPLAKQNQFFDGIVIQSLDFHDQAIFLSVRAAHFSVLDQFKSALSAQNLTVDSKSAVREKEAVVAELGVRLNE